MHLSMVRLYCCVLVYHVLSKMCDVNLSAASMFRMIGCEFLVISIAFVCNNPKVSLRTCNSSSR